MPEKQIFTLIGASSDFAHAIIDLVGAILMVSLLKLILRSPKARPHRRWVVPFCANSVIDLAYRGIYDTSLFSGTRLSPAPALALRLLLLGSSLLWLYGATQLWKVFRELARRHTNQSLASTPFEEWPADTPPAAANLWDTSQT